MTARVEVTIRCDWDGCPQVFRASNLIATVSGARGRAEASGWGVEKLAGGRHYKNSNDRNGTDLCPPHYREHRGITETAFMEAIERTAA
ncbi:MAG: hypothetical protein FWG25_01185 [Promicromonosporaceae bacterium]|nr:hypothetical protein [Promicromonosporaceae bacterium]